MNRRGRAGEVEDFVDFDIEGKADVVPHQLEPRIQQEMVDVVPSTRIEIVEAKHFIAPIEQSRAQMGADESGSPGDENASFGQHGRAPRDR
jgi:hypothetical protein